MTSSHPQNKPSSWEQIRQAPLFSAWLTGWISGVFCGLFDGALSWSAAAQFAEPTADRILFLVFLMISYGFTGGLIFLAIGAFLLGLNKTYLGRLLSSGLQAHKRLREKDPRDALLALCVVLATAPTLGLVLGLIYKSTARSMALKKHMGLVVAVSMVWVLLAVIIGLVVGAFLALGLERLLRRMIRSEKTARRLSSLWFLFALSAGVLTVGGALGVKMSWHVLKLLNLRPLWVALFWSALILPSCWIAARLLQRIVRRRVFVAILASCLGWFGLLWAGSSASVRKSAAAYSGLGGHLTRAYRTLGDWDKDGFSTLLGGGDCDDSDPAVHPAAIEIPDDGIDQNCVGGDVSTKSARTRPTFAQVPEGVPEDFNVLFISIDTVRSDHFGSYGYERDTTPALDKLANEGFLFENAWAHAPSTRYSMPAVLTGRYPLNVHYDYTVRGWPGLLDKATTIPELMKNEEMVTGAILNHWYFAPTRNMNQGVDYYDNQNARLHVQSAKEGPAKSSGSSSRQQSDKAIRFIQKHANERFFLWVHYYDPHYEYERHKGVPYFGDDPIDLYDHEIRFTDDHIARVIEKLKSKGLYDKTVIVVTGDHGEGFGEHSIDLHGYHLYSAQTRVPLIIRVPGMKPARIETPAGHVDVLPTLANLLGTKPTTEMMGKSLVGLMSGAEADTEDRYIFQQLSFGSNNEMRAAASRNCHVIYNISPHNSWELYNIALDPNETKDIIDRPGDCKAAKEALAHWYDLSEIPPGAGDALLSEEPSLTKPIKIEFGEQVLLREVLVPKNPVKPGENIPITLTFKARGKLEGRWQVFMHLEQGRHRIMGDHTPARPFSWWSAGQHIRYQTEVPIPRNAKPGPYKVKLGIYQGNERLDIVSSDVPHEENRASVGTLRVKR